MQTENVKIMSLKKLSNESSPDEASLLGGRLLGAVEGQLDVAPVRAHARVFDQLVHLRKINFLTENVK